jgi:myo-inositol-1(or 4)-monophosphatase
MDIKGDKMPNSVGMKTIMFQCAEAASAILLKHFGKIESVVKKGEVDLVTVADKEAEKAIIRRIQIAFPSHAIQGEESGNISPEQEKAKSPGKRASRQFAPGPPALRPSVSRPSVSRPCAPRPPAPRPSVSRPPEYCWLIDPLDGTMNFAHGNPVFTVSIALLRGGRPIMGLVADPMRGEWYFAERGKGAWLYTRRGGAGLAGSGARGGGVADLFRICDSPAGSGARGGGGRFRRRRIRVSSVRRLGESLIYTGFPHNRREIAAQLAQTLQALLMCTHGVSRQGSAALDLCFVASGRCEAFYEPKLEPWDLAAGALIVEEAGGRCTDYAGRRMITPGTRIVATNGHIHGALLRVIRENWTD